MAWLKNIIKTQNCHVSMKVYTVNLHIWRNKV